MTTTSDNKAISANNQNPWPVQEVAEPNLYRETFTYERLPRASYDGQSAPLDLPETIWITDTTFRDGQQARAPYSCEQAVRLYDLMHKLDGGAGIIRQSEFFLYSERDRQIVRKCLERGYKFPQVTGWIRAIKSDFKLVKDIGLTETGILTSCSDYHIFLKLRKSRTQVLDMYLDTVKAALDSGILPRCHFEDITRADLYGFVLPLAVELIRLGQQYDVKIKIRMCDTMGVGLPWPQAALPRSIPKIAHALRHELGIDSEQLEFHGHNDLHKVVANSVAAWLYGCASCNSTLLGIGERTGNAPLEALVVELAQLRPEPLEIDYTVITEIAQYYEKELGQHIADNYPLVGRDFNVTRAGIHADGLLKNEEIYNIFDTHKLLKRPVRVMITDKSGVAGVKHWIEQHYELEPLAKTDPRLTSIYEQIMAKYEAGRTTSLSDEEMAQWVSEKFGQLPPKAQ
ncbi:MAG: 2-isopropylmalate synthase [Actinobacteria bacterium]|nr:2-isopropylmalate synthase [Actinomycetota bacterium]